MNNRLKQLRMCALIESQRDLARQINKKYGKKTISYGTIAKIEKGNYNPNWKTILTLAKFFNVTPHYLMCFDDK